MIYGQGDDKKPRLGYIAEESIMNIFKPKRFQFRLNQSRDPINSDGSLTGQTTISGTCATASTVWIKVSNSLHCTVPLLSCFDFNSVIHNIV